MADEAKHCNLICSTFEALVVPCAVGHCGGELSPFCWPMLALGIVVFGASHWFAKHISQMQWLHWDSGSRPTADHPAMTRTFFWCKFGFEKCFGASFQSSHWDSYHWLSCKIHFCCMSQLCNHIMITCPIKKWFIAQSRNGSLLPRIREDNTLKRFFFFFPVSSWGSHLPRFFTFPICSKCQTIVEWPMFGSLATSPVAVRGSKLQEDQLRWFFC